MINVYINGTLRNDIEIETGGSLETESTHKSSSALSVRVPVDSVDLQEGDYIRLTDSGTTAYAGTILGIDQVNIQITDFSCRLYSLSVAGNEDYVSSVYVDLSFPAGANVTQILYGNQPGDHWYNSAIGKFYGIIPIRIAPEGITTGTVDDFSTVVLTEAATLWGMPVSDLLDKLCDAAGAWWCITADKVFSMRFTAARDTAPFDLEENAPAYDIEPSRDAYTLYSAVRVIGNTGDGMRIDDAAIFNTVVYASSTEITLRYPISKNLSVTQVVGGIHTELAVGWRGIDDNSTSIQILVSYGSNTITAVNGYTFPSAPYTSGNNIICTYIPRIPVVARLFDEERAAEIRAQRGGTGIVEYTLKDDTLTDFDSAMQAGVAFMDSNAVRANTVRFGTRVPGWEVGQKMAGDIPYYHVSGTYLVTTVQAAVIFDKDTETAEWEYTVTASTAAYRDTYSKLFAVGKTIGFKINSDVPASDGRYIDSRIEVRTTINLQIAQPHTWAQIQTQCATLAQLAAAYPTFAAIENILKEWTTVGNFLTQSARNAIRDLFLGKGLSVPLTFNGVAAYDSAGNWIGPLSLTAGPDIGDGSASSTYMALSTDLNGKIAALRQDAFDDQISGAEVTIQSVPVDIDASANNPMGSYVLTVIKKDEVI